MMQSQGGSRKRAAPGTSPIAQQQSAPQNYQYPQNAMSFPTYPYTDPTADGSLTYPGNQTYNLPLSSTNPTGSAGQNPNLAASQTSPLSNQLVRRNLNQQLAARNGGVGPSQWDVNISPPQAVEPKWEEMNDEHELDQKAALAKKDAQAKRKQIPPFVLKLWR